jgi:hypothetical protein
LNKEESMRKLLVGGGLALATLAAAAVPAFAAPTNAPNAFHGLAQCGAAGTFNFVVNNANGQGQGAMNNGANQGEWAPAHLSNGGIFHPTAFVGLTFTFTAPDGSSMSFTNNDARPNQTGDTTCRISGSQSSPQGTFSLAGSVIGNITAGK